MTRQPLWNDGPMISTGAISAAWLKARRRAVRGSVRPFPAPARGNRDFRLTRRPGLSFVKGSTVPM